MNRLVFTTLLVLLLGGCGPVNVLTLDKSAEFARVETGLTSGATRARVVELMGAPVEQSYRDVLGISHEQLTFKDSKRKYAVTLIHGVAVSKSIENPTH